MNIEKERLSKKKIEKDKKRSERASVNIFNAILRKDVKAVKAILDKVPDPHARNQEGQSWISLGVKSERDEIIRAVKEYVENEKIKKEAKKLLRVLNKIGENKK